MLWLFYTLVSCRKLWLFSSLQLLMPVIKCVMIFLHLIVSCRELWLYSSLQHIIMTLKKQQKTTTVSWLFHTLLFLAENSDYMFVFATNYACKKSVMIVLHFIVSCRCSSLQLIIPVTNVSWLLYTLLFLAENYDYVCLYN